MTSLGQAAFTGILTANNLNVPYVSTGQVAGEITFANDGESINPRGFYVVDTTGGNTGVSVGDGKVLGDSIEFVHYHSGGNAFTLSVKLSGVNKTITTGPTHSGQYYKLIWVTAGSLSPGWVITARSSLADAAIDAVEGMPVIA